MAQHNGAERESVAQAPNTNGEASQHALSSMLGTVLLTPLSPRCTSLPGEWTSGTTRTCQHPRASPY